MSQAHGLANLAILLGPIAIGLILGLVVVNAGLRPLATATLSAAAYLLGFVCFVAAKISVIRQGHLISFGSRPMSRGYRRLYRVGYGLMVSAVVLTLGLLAAQKAKVQSWPANPAFERTGGDPNRAEQGRLDDGRSTPRYPYGSPRRWSTVSGSGRSAGPRGMS